MLEQTKQWTFKVNSNLEIINRLITTLDLQPSEYEYNALLGTITSSKAALTSEFVVQKIKDLGFEFLISNKEAPSTKLETVTEEGPFVNMSSIDRLYSTLLDKYNSFKAIETKIDHANNKIFVTVQVKVKDFDNTNYQVALILTNAKYTTKEKTNSEQIQEFLEQIGNDLGVDFTKPFEDYTRKYPKEVREFFKAINSVKF